MPEMHVNPGSNQAMLLPCPKSKSGGIQDMTTVQSSVIVVYGPIVGAVIVPGTKQTTLSASPVNVAPASLTLMHQFTHGEFTVAAGFKAGNYVAIPFHTLAGGGDPIQGQPSPFKLKNPWEKLNN